MARPMKGGLRHKMAATFSGAILAEFRQQQQTKKNESPY